MTTMSASFERNAELREAPWGEEPASPGSSPRPPTPSLPLWFKEGGHEFNILIDSNRPRTKVLGELVEFQVRQPE